MQLIITEISGLKGTFLEIFEFYENSALFASCGFAPFSLCERSCIKIKAHDWGGTGGIMNISDLKTGNINLFNLYETDGKLNINAFSGKGILPEKFQEEGWSRKKGPKIPSLEISFDCEIDLFKNNITSPHYIIVYGNVIDRIKEYCMIANIKFNYFA
jgi:hypothetical protein